VELIGDGRRVPPGPAVARGSLEAGEPQESFELGVGEST